MNLWNILEILFNSVVVIGLMPQPSYEQEHQIQCAECRCQSFCHARFWKVNDVVVMIMTIGAEFITSAVRSLIDPTQ